MIERKISVTVFRYDPQTKTKPHYETYSVPYRPGMFVLDALIYIYENFSSSLAFQYSCRSRRCGTCAVLVNGSPSLACKSKIEGDVTILPLPGFRVIRDLITDLGERDKKILRIGPLQRSKKPSEEPEILAADSIQKYIDLTKCINCYICLSSCPVTMESSKIFAGPDLLLQLARRVYDPRDDSDRTKTACDFGLYHCTTCSECQISCPKELSPLKSIIDLRSIVVEKGLVTPTIRDMLESVFKNGNPWGGVRDRRSKWIHDLDVKHVSLGAEILYFVGCTSAYDPRVQKVARSFIGCLKEAKIDFGILGNEENCCGNEVYGIGEKGLFSFLVEENMKIFNKYNVKRVVTSCPHSYNAFKNIYGQLDFKTEHHSQLLASLIENGELTFSKEIRKNITYQDPCFLGRQNGIYDEPRKIIESLPGANFIELERSREKSLCCGGGGGRMWVDIPRERLAEIRIKEAVEAKGEIFATACPFCLLSLEDAVKTMGFEDKIKVMDIAELVSQAI